MVETLQKFGIKLPKKSSPHLSSVQQSRAFAPPAEAFAQPAEAFAQPAEAFAQPAEAFAPLLTEANLDVIGYKNFIAGQVLNILGYDLDREFTHRAKSVDIYQIMAFAKHITDVGALVAILDGEYNSRGEAKRTNQKNRLLAELARQGIRVVTDSKFNFIKMAPYLVYT